MPFILRSATVDDISQIMKIENESFANGIRETKNTFLDRINTFSAGFLLLCDTVQINSDNKQSVIGYLCSEIWDVPATMSNDYFNNPSLFTLDHSAFNHHSIDGNTLYISSMGLLSSFRGKGLGKYLFHEAVVTICNSFSSINNLLLLVNEYWISAQKIYKGEGFQSVAILDKFFHLKENGIVMTRNLLSVRDSND